MRHSQLPLEILEFIIESIPISDKPLALPATDSTTKTLYSCLTVCKATFPRSMELLYDRCLYIDSPGRLQNLVHAYSFWQSEPPGYLQHYNRILAASLSLYLAPFAGDDIDEPQVIEDIHTLFDLLADGLKRLVIDMPLRSSYPDEPAGRSIRPTLRHAFKKLKKLEEFVSVRDELYLSTVFPDDWTVEPPVWSFWPRLRKLALYNQDIDEDLPKALRQLPTLELLLLTRPDGVYDLEVQPLVDVLYALPPFAKVLVLNTYRGHAWLFQETLQANGLRDRVDWNLKGYIEDDWAGATLGVVCADRANKAGNVHSYDETFDDIEFCQLYVKERALNGSLWDR